MPPRKFLKITPSKIESEGIFSDLIAIMFMSVYSYLIQNTFGVKKARPSKVESYLEVNT